MEALLGKGAKALKKNKEGKTALDLFPSLTPELKEKFTSLEGGLSSLSSFSSLSLPPLLFFHLSPFVIPFPCRSRASGGEFPPIT